MESSKDEYLPREIKLLVIHCSATRCNVSFPVERLRECHLQRGFRDIGYHFYITRDGVLHHCRPVSEIGAHVIREKNIQDYKKTTGDGESAASRSFFVE